MSWVDRQLQQYRLEKQIDNAMKTEKYRQYEREHDIQVFDMFVLIAVDFLYRKYGYKKKRTEEFLNFVGKQMEYSSDDNDYFRLLNEALIDDVGFDVLDYMDMKPEDWKKGDKDEKEKK